MIRIGPRRVRAPAGARNRKTAFKLFSKLLDPALKTESAPDLTFL